MILKQPLALNAIRIFRGVVDIYKSRGQIIARRWPSSPRQPNNDGQLRARDDLRRTIAAINASAPSWHALWQAVALPWGRTANDLQRKHLLWLYSRDLYAEPPDVISANLLWTPTDTNTTAILTCNPPLDPTAPARTEWRWATYQPGHQTLAYHSTGSWITREGAIAHTIAPDVAEFAAVLSQSWTPQNNRWVILLPGQPLPVRLLAYPHTP